MPHAWRCLKKVSDGLELKSDSLIAAWCGCREPSVLFNCCVTSPASPSCISNMGSGTQTRALRLASILPTKLSPQSPQSLLFFFFF